MSLTRRGFLLLFVTAIFIGLALVSPIFYWLALLYFVLALVVLWLDAHAAGDVSRFILTRQNDSKLSLGAYNPVQLTVRETSGKPTTIWLRDEFPDRFQFKQQEYVIEAPIGSRETLSHTYHVRPLRRGDYAFGVTNIRWLTPLGLLRKQANFDNAEAVKVYPNLQNIKQYDLFLKRNKLQMLGLRNTRQIGEGTEFERLRDYVPDDTYKHINWKATARRNKPITTQFQTERSQTIMTLIDTGRKMQSPVEDMTKLDYVINAVLMLTYVAGGMGDKVGTMSFAADVQQYLPAKQGKQQFYRALELLYGIRAQSVEPDYPRAISYLKTRQRKRALVILFTDLSSGMGMTQLIESIATLSRKSLVLVVTINDPDISEAAGKIPEDVDEVYVRRAAVDHLTQRRLALDTLHQRGVFTLDVSADKLAIGVINRYLDLKKRLLL